MADKVNKDKLLRSANTYLELGKLLKKKRGSWARREVEKIITQESSDTEKIIAIKKVDEAALIDQEIKKNRAKESKAHKEAAVNIKTKPLENLQRSNVILYLFFHFRRIQKFAQKSRSLELHFPSPFYTLTPNVKVSLKSIYDKIQGLFEPLDYFLKNSWMVLTKEEYNIIHAFYHWCDEFYNIYLKKFENNDLLLVEKEFLTVIQTKENKELLMQAVEKAVENTPYKNEKENILRNTFLIIDDEEMKPSFTQILLAYHISNLHRFIKLDDLLFFEKPPFIKKNMFQGDDNLQNKIRQFLWQKELLLKEKNKELQLIEFIERNFVRDFNNHPFEYLKNFSPKYDISHKGKKEIINFHNDIDDLAYFIHELLKEYEIIFKSFTTNKVSLVSTENKIIQEKLTPYSLKDHFKKIEEDHRLIVELIDHKAIIKTNFKRYIHYAREGRFVEDTERSLFDILMDLSRVFYDIALKLFQNYMNEMELNKKSQDERFKILQEKDIFEKTIPFAKGRLNLNHFISHKSVTEAYLLLIEFAVNFALLFENQELIAALSKKENLLNEIENLKSDIERIK